MHWVIFGNLKFWTLNLENFLYEYMPYIFPKKTNLQKYSYSKGKIEENHILKTHYHLKYLNIKDLLTANLGVIEKGKGYCQFIIRSTRVCSKIHRLSAVDTREELQPLFYQNPPGIWGPHKIKSQYIKNLNLFAKALRKKI